jgi:uncharacterized membrane protein
MKTFVSDISGQTFSLQERVVGRALRPALLLFIQHEYPHFTRENYLSLAELNNFREEYIEECLVKDRGKLSALESKVLKSLQDQSIVSDELEDTNTQILTTGQRIADKVATFGGSWVFISAFGIFLLVWIFANVFWLHNKGFDPYPFILLNLILSCLAAIQAPIIMMSQNRQEEKDRERAKKDYMVNLKSELEIRMLHEKIDLLMMHQQQELLEVQQLQVEMLNDILKEIAILQNK